MNFKVISAIGNLYEANSFTVIDTFNYSSYQLLVITTAIVVAK